MNMSAMFPIAPQRSPIQLPAGPSEQPELSNARHTHRRSRLPVKRVSLGAVNHRKCSALLFLFLCLLTFAASGAEGPLPPVAGTVWQQDGKPAANADIWWVLEDDRGTAEILKGVTSATGQFRFVPREKPVGRHQSASLLIAPRGQTLSPYTLRKEDTGDLQLQLWQATEVEVLVVDEAGKPVEGLTLQPNRLVAASSNDFVFDFPPELAKRFAAVTNREGICRFKNLPCNARLTVSIEDERFAKPSFDEKLLLGNGPVSEGQTIKLLPAATMAGQVIFKDTGKPASGVYVSAQGIFRAGAKPAAAAAKTDESGRYVIKQMRPASYNVALGLTPVGLQDDWTARAHENITITAGQQIAGMNFELIPGATIVGKVTAQTTGQPIPSADIAIYGPAHPQSSAWVQTTLTKADGSYLLRVPAGAQYLYFRSASPEFGSPTPSSHKIELVDGETRTINFALPPK